MLPLQWTARGKKKAGYRSLVFSGGDGWSPVFPDGPIYSPERCRYCLDSLGSIERNRFGSSCRGVRTIFLGAPQGSLQLSRPE
jgi:hypothetical protein